MRQVVRVEMWYSQDPHPQPHRDLALPTSRVAPALGPPGPTASCTRTRILVATSLLMSQGLVANQNRDQPHLLKCLL